MKVARQLVVLLLLQLVLLLGPAGLLAAAQQQQTQQQQQDAISMEHRVLLLTTKDFREYGAAFLERILKGIALLSARSLRARCQGYGGLHTSREGSDKRARRRGGAAQRGAHGALACLLLPRRAATILSLIRPTTHPKSGYGVPLEVVEVDAPTAPADFASLFWEGTPFASAARFSAVAMHPDVENSGGDAADSLLARRQLQALHAFQRHTGARVLKFGAEATAAGLEPAPGGCVEPPEAATAVADGAGGQAALTAAAPLGISGVRPGAALSVARLRRCPAAVDAGGDSSGQCCSVPKEGAPLCFACTATPVLRSPPPPPPPAPAAAAGARAAAAAAAAAAPPPPQTLGALVRHGDGRQALAFFLDCLADSAACYALGHLGLAWALKNIVPGRRRALLSMQVDDVLLGTANAASGGSYRLTPGDLLAHAAWQEALARRLPNGSSVRLDLAFNGNGAVLEAGGGAGAILENVPACFETALYSQLGCSCWGKAMAACPAAAPLFCRQCTKDWRRPRGSAGATYNPVSVCVCEKERRRGEERDGKGEGQAASCALNNSAMALVA